MGETDRQRERQKKGFFALLPIHFHITANTPQDGIPSASRLRSSSIFPQADRITLLLSHCLVQAMPRRLRLQIVALPLRSSPTSRPVLLPSPPRLTHRVPADGFPSLPALSDPHLPPLYPAWVPSPWEFYLSSFWVSGKLSLYRQQLRVKTLA